MSVEERRLLDEAVEKLPGSTIEAAARVLRAGEQPLRAAFLARVFNAVARAVTEMDERALGDAAGASSDYAALLKMLERPEAVAELSPGDPLAEARLRGLRMRERLLGAEGGTVSAGEAGELLGGISRQAVDKRRRAGRLLALPAGGRGYRYPVWQFAEGGVLPGLEEVLPDLGVGDPWMRAAFFLGGNVRLEGDTPLEELRRGRVEKVRRAARSYGEQGAA